MFHHPAEAAGTPPLPPAWCRTSRHPAQGTLRSSALRRSSWPCCRWSPWAWRGGWFPPLVAGAVPRWVFWLWGCVVSALSRCVGFVPVVSVALRSARCRVAPWGGSALGLSFRRSRRSLSGFVAVARFSSFAAASRGRGVGGCPPAPAFARCGRWPVGLRFPCRCAGACRRAGRGCAPWWPPVLLSTSLPPLPALVWAYNPDLHLIFTLCKYN